MTVDWGNVRFLCVRIWHYLISAYIIVTLFRRDDYLNALGSTVLLIIGVFISAASGWFRLTLSPSAKLVILTVDVVIFDSFASNLFCNELWAMVLMTLDMVVILQVMYQLAAKCRYHFQKSSTNKALMQLARTGGGAPLPSNALHPSFSDFRPLMPHPHTPFVAHDIIKELEMTERAEGILSPRHMNLAVAIMAGSLPFSYIYPLHLQLALYQGQNIYLLSIAVANFAIFCVVSLYVCVVAGRAWRSSGDFMRGSNLPTYFAFLAYGTLHSCLVGALARLPKVVLSLTVLVAVLVILLLVLNNQFRLYSLHASPCFRVSFGTRDSTKTTSVTTNSRSRPNLHVSKTTPFQPILMSWVTEEVDKNKVVGGVEQGLVPSLVAETPLVCGSTFVSLYHVNSFPSTHSRTVHTHADAIQEECSVDAENVQIEDNEDSPVSHDVIGTRGFALVRVFTLSVQIFAIVRAFEEFGLKSSVPWSLVVGTLSAYLFCWSVGLLAKRLLPFQRLFVLIVENGLLSWMSISLIKESSALVVLSLLQLVPLTFQFAVVSWLSSSHSGNSQFAKSIILPSASRRVLQYIKTGGKRKLADFTQALPVLAPCLAAAMYAVGVIMHSLLFMSEVLENHHHPAGAAAVISNSSDSNNNSSNATTTTTAATAIGNIGVEYFVLLAAVISVGALVCALIQRIKLRWKGVLVLTDFPLKYFMFMAFIFVAKGNFSERRNVDVPFVAGLLFHLLAVIMLLLEVVFRQQNIPG